MVKQRQREEDRATTPAPESPRLRRLERRLADVRALEARRFRRFEKARKRGVKLSAAITALRQEQDAAAKPHEPATEGPRGYCMREKQMVSIADPEPTVLRNGRAAISGVCPSCGAKVSTTARAAVGTPAQPAVEVEA